jgi:hypothetical protein
MYPTVPRQSSRQHLKIPTFTFYNNTLPNYRERMPWLGFAH